MAELIAGLDGPVYVERVALFDAKQRVKAAEGDPEGAAAPGGEQGLRASSRCSPSARLTWARRRRRPSAG